MFNFAESDTFVVVTYDPDGMDSDIFRSFARGVSNLNAAYRLDFLLDLRGLTGPLDILSNEELGRQWASQARGRDVGRRTAIVTTDIAIQGQVEVFQGLYPFRTIAAFPEYDAAAEWVSGIKGQDDADTQYI